MCPYTGVTVWQLHKFLCEQRSTALMISSEVVYKVTILVRHKYEDYKNKNLNTNKIFVESGDVCLQAPLKIIASDFTQRYCDPLYEPNL